MNGWFYDRKGKPCVFLYEDRFISRDGHDIGWLVNNRDIYSRTGEHIGWFEADVIFDACNRVLAFQQGAIVSLPFVPYTVSMPESPCIPSRPDQPEFHAAPIKPEYCSGWSHLDAEELFLKEHGHVTAH